MSFHLCPSTEQQRPGMYFDFPRALNKAWGQLNLQELISWTVPSSLLLPRPYPSWSCNQSAPKAQWFRRQSQMAVDPKNRCAVNSSGTGTDQQAHVQAVQARWVRTSAPASSWTTQGSVQIPDCAIAQWAKLLISYMFNTFATKSWVYLQTLHHHSPLQIQYSLIF